MVYSALITTERAAAKRLEDRGFDAAGIQAQVDALTKQIEDAKKKKENPPAANPSLAGPVPQARTTQEEQIQRSNLLELAQGLQTVQLDLGVLKPKLEKCALRAQGAG